MNYKLNDTNKTRENFLFLLGFIVPILFAVYTNNAWEDWYITYRSSKNLAIGNGLVYNIGDRLHTFTSPLGVLIPAFLNFITRNLSDTLVLWLFRIFNSLCIGISTVLLLRICQKFFQSQIASFFAIALLLFDVKSIDNSINGMETAMMIGWMLWLIYALLVVSKNQILAIGIALGGLMWTRPDSFVYFLPILLGSLLFLPETSPIISRLQWFKNLVLASFVAAAIYLPWFIFAWLYYGSPVPNTIVAKGLGHILHLQDIFYAFLKYPYTAIVTPNNFLTQVFTPGYAYFGDWHPIFFLFSKLLVIIGMFYWLLPNGKKIGRICSLGVFMGVFYLGYVVPTAYPWYIPTITLFCIITLACIFDQLLTLVTNRFVKYLIYGVAEVILIFQIIIFAGAAYEISVQQTTIEDGNRKQIGMWLKNNANPHDTVFLECLGYIGFYSQLKMYDFPGLSSSEMINERKKLKENRDNYDKIIEDLQPNWLVLRNTEIHNINQEGNILENYTIKKIFSEADAIEKYKFLPGRNLLLYDQTFTLFKRNVSSEITEAAKQNYHPIKYLKQ